MRIEDLAKKHASSINGYELVKYFEVACPVYKVELNITMQKKKKISVIQEFCLKFLDCGINDINQITGFLGLNRNIVIDNIAELTTLELIKVLSNEMLSITDKGKEILKELILLAPENITYPIYIDALTKEAFMSNKIFDTAKRIKDIKMQALIPNINTPTIQDFQFKDVSKCIKKYSQENPTDDRIIGELIAINGISKSYIMYKKLNILVFYNSETNDMDIKVFEKADRVQKYEDIILTMQNKGIKQIGLDRKMVLENENDEGYLLDTLPKKVVEEAWENERRQEIVNNKVNIIEREIKEHKESIKDELLDIEQKVTATQRVRELEVELEHIKKENKSRNKIINTYEHRPILINALEKVRNFIVIVSPWIKYPAFDYELEMLIQKAVNKKVRVYIGYGISEKEDSDEQIIKRLNQMQQKHKNLFLIKLANTHEKVLISDSEFMVITSFNWLSFKGNPDWGFRQETGIYTEEQQTITTMIKNLEGRMGISILKNEA